MNRFTGKIEYLKDQPGAAIVALFDSRGEWCGAGRIDIRSKRISDLYEAGYVHASGTAVAKGGMLDRFLVVEAL